MKQARQVVALKQVGYQYTGAAEEGEQALSGIDLPVQEGTLIVLTGQSGCGKTTITRCINGLIPYFYDGNLEGEVSVLQQNTREMPLHAIGKQVASVFQDPRSQFFTTNSSCEVAFACENYGVARNEMIDRVIESFRVLHIEDLVDRKVFDLSSGERQKIAFASAHALSPSIFVLDEPSANLDIASIMQMREILAVLKKQGHTIILSEHRLFYLEGLIDTLYRMEAGKIAEAFSQQQLQALLPGELERKGVRQLYWKKIPFCPHPVLGTGQQPLLEVKNLSCQYDKSAEVLQSVSFSASQSEVVALVGANGCGKTTFGKVLAGLIRGSRGAVSLQGREVPMRKLSNDVYYVMQEADHQLYTDSVASELRLGQNESEGIEEKIDEILRDLGISDKKECHPHALSGGQKQRLTIAAAALTAKPVIILDEPTSGLDYASMCLVAGVVNRLAKAGKLVLVITHDLEFIGMTATRAVHLQDGHFAEDVAVQIETDFRTVAGWMMPQTEERGEGA